MDNEERLYNRDDLKHAEEFYKTKLAPNLTREEKEELKQQLQERIKQQQQLCRRKGKYTRCIYLASDFPQIEQYWEMDDITDIELISIYVNIWADLKCYDKG